MVKAVKVVTLAKSRHSLTNKAVVNTINEVPDAYFAIKVDDALKVRGLTQRELSLMTGIRVGTLSELINGKGTGFNKTHLIAIMVALRITELSELIEVRMPESVVVQYERERAQWIESKHLPNTVKALYKKNLLETANINNNNNNSNTDY